MSSAPTNCLLRDTGWGSADRGDGQLAGDRHGFDPQHPSGWQAALEVGQSATDRRGEGGRLPVEHGQVTVDLVADDHVVADGQHPVGVVAGVGEVGARPGVVEQDSQPGPVGGGDGLLVQIDPLGVNTDGHKRVDLAVEVLLGGRDPRVAQLHAEHRTACPIRTRLPAPACGTNLWDGTRHSPTLLGR